MNNESNSSEWRTIADGEHDRTFKALERLTAAGFYGVQPSDRPPVSSFVAHLESEGKNIFSMGMTGLGECYKDFVKEFTPPKEK